MLTHKENNMKTLILTLLFCLITTSAFAVTQEQLQEAAAILSEIDSKVTVLRGYVQTALAGEIKGIALTLSQRQNLKNKYLAEKADLVTLYNLLP